MTADLTPTTTTGWDENSATDWVRVDQGNTRLSYPWKLTALIASYDSEVRRVLDVGSGPGGYLGAVLDQIADATGVWFDFSETMRTTAETNLERFGDRVSYVYGDIVDLDATGDPGSFDLVTTSRASHHLLVGDLGRFYASAAKRLRIGGWFANVDGFNMGEPWNARLRSLSRTMSGRALDAPAASNHPHLHPAPSLDDHIACLRAAGFESAQVVWSELSRGLIMARKAAPPDPLVRS